MVTIFSGDLYTDVQRHRGARSLRGGAATRGLRPRAETRCTLEHAVQLSACTVHPPGVLLREPVR